MQQKNAGILLKTKNSLGTISPLLYGHFAEHIGGVIYDGIWVGKDSHIPNIKGFRLDIVEKLRRISPSVIRWPGGCFAESYNWRDGIGENRPIRPSWWTERDNLYENNEFGTHEFIEFCKLIGAEPYLAINVTSLSPMDARDWVDYCNSPKGSTTLALEREKNGSAEPFDVKFFGIGNENWGGGGTMTAAQYAIEYRKYATMVKNIAPKAKLIAGGATYHSSNWTKTFISNMKEVYGTPVPLDAISFHYYFSDKNDTKFSNENWGTLIESANNIENHIKELISILVENKYDKRIKLYIDEWGAMYDTGVGATEKNQLYRQQVTIRDAVAAALTLNIYNNYCNLIEMANIAQITNCLSSLFLTDGEHCITTPIYHVFDMYKGHQGGSLIETEVSDTEISCSASVKDGNILLTLANLSCTEDKTISIKLGDTVAKTATLTQLTATEINEYNDFDSPNKISPVEAVCDLSHPICIPRASVVSVSIEDLG